LSKNTNYIIVGQGLAGSLLAWLLLESGKQVHIIDNAHQGAASAVAAGIMNPITGRRFVKSWLFDDLIVEAQELYTQLEKSLDTKFYHPREILRTIPDIKTENDWLGKSTLPDYEKYMGDLNADENYESHFKNIHGLVKITNAGQVNIPILIKAFQKYFETKSIFQNEKFDYGMLQFVEDKVQYGDIIADKIIFCEGYQAMNNPYFNYLPFEPAKGEVLIVKIPSLPQKNIFKHKVLLAPLGNELFWVGSTYKWYFDDDLPTEEKKIDIQQRLEKSLNIPFEIIDHQAAIRPTVKDRRPFLGFHPRFPQLGIFNGLGTKGASLAPYWAKHFEDFLINGNQISEEVDIARFNS